MSSLERRHNPHKVEMRTMEGRPTVFVGRAVVYDQWSELLFGAFRERIAPGTFDESLRSGDDLYASVDHDPSRVLGRLSSGTLTVMPHPAGIDIEVARAGYTYATDLAIAIERGDLRGMSFIFDVTDDMWHTVDGIPHRTVTRAKLYEVSFVYFPAYQQTEASVRCLQRWRDVSLARRRRQLWLADQG